MRGEYRVLVGRPEGSRSFGKHRRRWEDIIKMYIQDVGRRGMDWTDLVQDKDVSAAFVDVVTNLRIPSTTWKFFAR
jgi:hypothetical protein